MQKHMLYFSKEIKLALSWETQKHKEILVKKCLNESNIIVRKCRNASMLELRNAYHIPVR